jgi:hypothetical protein
VEAALRRVLDAAPGLPRHAALVAALIEAGGVATAVADAVFSERGVDAPCAVADRAMAVVLRLAAAVRESWEGVAAGGVARGGGVPDQGEFGGGLLGKGVPGWEAPDRGPGGEAPDLGLLDLGAPVSGGASFPGLGARRPRAGCDSRPRAAADRAGPRGSRITRCTRRAISRRRGPWCAGRG